MEGLLSTGLTPSSLRKLHLLGPQLSFVKVWEKSLIKEICYVSCDNQFVHGDYIQTCRDSSYEGAVPVYSTI